MKNKLYQSMALGTAVAAFASLTSCDGDNGAPGAQGPPGEPSEGVLTEVADMRLDYFPASRISFTVDTDANAGALEGWEFAYDLDSLTVADVTIEDDQNIQQVLDGPVDITELLYTDGDSVATIALLDETNGLLDLANVTMTYSSIIGNTLLGTFTAGIDQPVADVTVDHDAPTQLVQSADINDVADLFATKTIVSAYIGEEVLDGSTNTTLYTIGANEVLFVVTAAGNTEYYVVDYSLAGATDIVVDTTALTVTIPSGSSLSLPATSVQVTIGQNTPLAPIASPTLSQLEFFTGDTIPSITGTFRQDLDPAGFQASIINQ